MNISHAPPIAPAVHPRCAVTRLRFPDRPSIKTPLPDSGPVCTNTYAPSLHSPLSPLACGCQTTRRCTGLRTESRRMPRACRGAASKPPKPTTSAAEAASRTQHEKQRTTSLTFTHLERSPPPNVSYPGAALTSSPQADCCSDRAPAAGPSPKQRSGPAVARGMLGASSRSLVRSAHEVPNQQQPFAREQSSPQARTEEKHGHQPDRERCPATNCIGAEASPDSGQAVKEPVKRPSPERCAFNRRFLHRHMLTDLSDVALLPFRSNSSSGSEGMNARKRGCG